VLKLNEEPVGQLGPFPGGGAALAGDNIGCVFIAATIRNIAMKIALTVNRCFENILHTDQKTNI
jgi:hypothetical protein